MNCFLVRSFLTWHTDGRTDGKWCINDAKKGGSLVPWCTTCFDGAQCRSVVHEVALYRHGGAQCRSSIKTQTDIWHRFYWLYLCLPLVCLCSLCEVLHPPCFSWTWPRWRGEVLRFGFGNTFVLYLDVNEPPVAMFTLAREGERSQTQARTTIEFNILIIKQLDVGLSPPAFSFTLIVTLTFDLDPFHLWQTDRRRRIRAHRAWAQVCSKMSQKLFNS